VDDYHATYRWQAKAAKRARELLDLS